MLSIKDQFSFYQGKSWWSVATEKISYFKKERVVDLLNEVSMPHSRDCGSDLYLLF